MVPVEGNDWTRISLADYTAEELKKQTENLTITHMRVRHDAPPNLHILPPHLTHLCIEHSPHRDTDWISGMSQLSRLEVLDLSNNDFSSRGLPDIISSLTSLRELYLWNCKLDNLPASMSQLSRLEVLKLSDNDFSSRGLPDILSTLTSLRKLHLISCKLDNLPTSMLQLSRLEVLHLSGNDFSSRGLPDIFSTLTSLRELHLWNCKLDNLPTSMSQLSRLEVLDLSGNDFSSRGLPDIISSLTSLRELHLMSCKLDNLPASISQLKNVQNLDISENMFKCLPAPVCDLMKLQSLELSENSPLTRLDSQIVHLPELKNIDTSYCTQLAFPPYEVCEQGVQAIRQYYTDIAESAAKQLPLATVTVIGQPLAGKTSMIRTLQNPLRKRVLTDRSFNAITDEATKVFNFEEVKVEDAVLRFIDMGGHEVYHVAYQLTLRQNCVPVIVVSIEQYKQLADAEGDREAVRRLFLDWMSHLYLAQPELGAPKLVISHKDKFSPEEYEVLKTQFMSAADSLRDEIVREETEMQTEIFRKIRCFSEPGVPLFALDNIYEVDNVDDNYQAFDSIKAALLAASQNYSKVLPSIWDEVNEVLQNLIPVFQSFDDLLERLHSTHLVERSQLKIIFTYLHDCGKLLWYKDIEVLKPYVFYKISAITKLLSVLYDHNEDAWDERIKRFQSTAIDGKMLETDEYRLLTQAFQNTGIMDQKLITYLVKTETEFRTDKELEIALTILTFFRLIHGPVKRENEVYIIPYFALGYMGNLLDECGEVNFQVDIKFKGLSLPQYVYNQMTIGLLELFPSEWDAATVKKNGATVLHDRTAISIVHDFKSRKATIQLSTNIEDIARSWKQLIEIVNNTVRHVQKTWSASRLICIFYCPHCLLRGKLHPERRVNPSWCILSESTQASIQLPTGHSKMGHLACGADRSIPSPLMFRCTELSHGDTDELKEYVSELKKETACPPPSKDLKGATISSKPFLVEDTVDSDISDGEGYFYPYDDLEKIHIGLRTQRTRKKHVKSLYYNTNQVYKMSSPIRGRALIVNNKDFGQSPRNGSEVDVDNMTTLVRQLSFEVSVHSNLTAAGFLKVISKETKSTDHEDYGMFMLVIMSHGTDNDCIYGIDYPNTVRLIDVYDLLSAENFPQMAGKPKFLIIQACSGDRKDFGNMGCQPPVKAANFSKPRKKWPKFPFTNLFKKVNIKPSSGTTTAETAVTSSEVPESAGAAPAWTAASEKLSNKLGLQLNVDDLLVIKSSFESYSSMRHAQLGSLFIRCLVTTFHKHASHRDVWSLCEIVQERVRKQTMQLAETFPDHGFGQVPVYFKTLTNRRKLYMFPRM